MKKLIFLLFFISKIQKKISKTRRKSLQEKLEELKSPLSAQDRSSVQHTLSAKKIHKEAQRRA